MYLKWQNYGLHQLLLIMPFSALECLQTLLYRLSQGCSGYQSVVVSLLTPLTDLITINTLLHLHQLLILPILVQILLLFQTGLNWLKVKLKVMPDT